MTTKTNVAKWLVWVHGAAMVPCPQIIMGEDSGPFLNEYVRTHFIKKVRIENDHRNLSLVTLLSYPVYQLDGDLLNDSIAKPQGSQGAASSS